MKAILIVLALFCGTAQANSIRDWFAINGDITLMGGLAHFLKQDDGTYWNRNQPADIQLMSPAAGVRYDSGWMAVQYTYFGMARVSALAVTLDAPHPGGYDRIAGACVGTCAELARWKVETETQSLAVIGVKRWGGWSVEGGVNIFEARTKANVVNTDGSLRFQYKENRYLDYGPMFGFAYQSGPWSLRAQFWKMEGRSKPGEDEIAQGAFGAGWQQTLLAGYTF